jgi:PAP2 superfamily.
MNIFDSAILHGINNFAHHSFIFDKLVYTVCDINLLKGGAFMILFWWLWFAKDENAIGEEGLSEKRKKLLYVLVGSIVAMFAARFLAIFSPMRPRPIHDPAIGFIVPLGVLPNDLDDWSSFPSDHAALFFSLATGFCYISKKMGIIALLYAVLVISVPRIYVGYHYPTDILSGALIGVVAVVLTNMYLTRWKGLFALIQWFYARKPLFYALLFFFTYQLVEMFYDIRVIGSSFVKVIHH